MQRMMFGFAGSAARSVENGDNAMQAMAARKVEIFMWYVRR